MSDTTSEEEYDSDDSTHEWSYHGFSVCREEAAFLDMAKSSHRYYVGYVSMAENSDGFGLVMDCVIQPATFLQYPYASVMDYLNSFSYGYTPSKRKIEIMYMTYGPFQSYDVVTKTHWLRLVQRTWKRVYAERKRQIHQCALNPLIVDATIMAFPSINGMLASVKKG